MGETVKSPGSALPAGIGTPPGVAVGSTSVGARELAKGAATLGVRRVRDGGDFDAGAAVCAWARGLLQRDRTAGLDIGLLGKRVHLVGDRAESEDVLMRAPDAGGQAGKPKVEGMGFLAPNAVTIADGDAWRTLRTFNEAVLGTGRPHVYAQPFLDHVRAAFMNRPRDVDAVRAAMGRAMLPIVLGDSAAGAPEAADDVSTLFDIVQRPVTRKVLGFRYKGKRAHLYKVLERAWDAAHADERSLIALAKRHAPAGVAREVLLQQIPHWMFTFTRSGTDLLVRTLVIATSRPAVRREVMEEADKAGPLDRAESVAQLDYLNACLLETGRLFPPVTKTFHAGGGATVAHYFPLLQRDDRLGHTVHGFRPLRWLTTELDAPASASNLFLRGPRACPGMHLILFVCRAALARLIAEHGITARVERLASDPLPVSFPKRSPVFTVAERNA